ncbi:unnamed protein product [Adineta ricciae]|uniref:TIL domain-containing protein n=1 Tax=Adineta ricciae TaxID=249248 RepID=A0A814PCH6_ADIRI|nr:unnamed protein product [Adineta ricciae]CAF1552994.1 unnamed protein product [Adineta ricciae]
MVATSRSTILLAMTVLVCALAVQARLDPSTRCLHKHEKYNSCGTACPLNCEDVLSSNLQKPCTLQCVAGCYCEKGYVRKTDDQNSPCVKMEDCYSDA